MSLSCSMLSFDLRAAAVCSEASEDGEGLEVDQQQAFEEPLHSTFSCEAAEWMPPAFEGDEEQLEAEFVRAAKGCCNDLDMPSSPEYETAQVCYWRTPSATIAERASNCLDMSAKFRYVGRCAELWLIYNCSI